MNFSKKETGEINVDIQDQLFLILRREFTQSTSNSLIHNICRLTFTLFHTSVRPEHK